MHQLGKLSHLLKSVKDATWLSLNQQTLIKLQSTRSVSLQMQEEFDMIFKNDRWELTPRPLNKNVIGVKWVHRTKFNSDSSIFKYKARLVVKGYA